MSYVPNPANGAEPLDSEKGKTAAAEFRALKTYIQSTVLAAIAAKLSSGSNVSLLVNDAGYRTTVQDTDGRFTPTVSDQVNCIVTIFGPSTDIIWSKTGDTVHYAGSLGIEFIVNNTASSFKLTFPTVPGGTTGSDNGGGGVCAFGSNSSANDIAVYQESLGTRSSIKLVFNGYSPSSGAGFGFTMFYTGSFRLQPS